MSNIQNIYIPFTRFALFIVYFWFGILKVLSLSPASPLVLELLDKTMPFMDQHLFLILFGLFEVLIGVLFLFPRTEKLALTLLVLHLITIMMPLILLPSITWSAPFLPTLEGQYIIKNVLIMSAALTLLAHRQRRLA
jgi:uncharacterized membrane protein YkgB